MWRIRLISILTSATLPFFANAAEKITSPGRYTSGEYVLRSDINVEKGSALVFDGPATLDLNGHSVQTVATGDDQDIGVEMLGIGSKLFSSKSGGRVTGFRVGAKLSGNRSLSSGIEFLDSRYMGIWVDGDDIRIVGGLISEVAGVSDEPYSFGIHVYGDDVLIENVVIKNIYPQALYEGDAPGEGVGINLSSPSSGGKIKNTLITNDNPTTGTYGIFGGSGGNHAVRASNVRNFWRGISVFGENGTSVIKNHVATARSHPGGYGISAGYGLISRNRVKGYTSPLDGAVSGDNVIE